MELIFCCKGEAKPYKPCFTDHEDKFRAFYEFANGNSPTHGGSEDFAIQFTKQVNIRPISVTRYFFFNDGKFVETNQAGLVSSGYLRANSYKKYKCCNYFYEVNLYTKSSIT